jgi:hypothetical protein
MYVGFSGVLLHHPLDALRSLGESVRNDDYNLLPVLPLTPFEWLWGPGRIIYILAIIVLFLLPGALALGLFAPRIVRSNLAGDTFAPIVLATASILILPSLWVPTLRGLPDVVGILVIGLILHMALTKPLAEQNLSKLLAIGFLLCLLVLLRRWYGFWSVAFLPSLVVARTFDLPRRAGISWRYYITTARNAAIVGMVFAVGLFGLATPLALRAIRTDYSDIYSAFRRSSSLTEAVGWLPLYFGWITIAVSCAGLAWLTLRQETRALGAFLIIQTIVVFLLFIRTQDFGIQHDYLLFPAIGVGVSTAVLVLWSKIGGRSIRMASVGLVFIALLVNAAIVLFPWAGGLSAALGRFAPERRYYPLVRNDIDAVGQLFSDLDSLEARQPGDIYVLSSSEALNSDIAFTYCQTGQEPRLFCKYLLLTNDVDKRDGFPLQFLRASYLVVTTPTQYHLRPDDQRVVGVLSRDVMAEHGIGASFQRLPGEFKLENGVIASVYVKIRPFERADLIALADEFIGYYPDKRDMFMTVDR